MHQHDTAAVLCCLFFCIPIPSPPKGEMTSNNLNRQEPRTFGGWCDSKLRYQVQFKSYKDSKEQNCSSKLV